jgi:membrane-associated protein
MVTWLIELVAGLGGPALIGVAFLLGFGESAIGLDLLVPGEVGMVITGAAGRASGAGLVPLVMAGAVGAILGDTVGYLIGRRWGRGIVQRWSWTRRRVEPELDRAERYFRRRGGWAVFGARWVGALRAVMPVVAGGARMPFRRFLLWDIPAACLWAGVVVSLGYYLGRGIAETVDRFGHWLSLGVLAALVIAVVIRRRARSGSRSGSAEGPEGKDAEQTRFLEARAVGDSDQHSGDEDHRDVNDRDVQDVAATMRGTDDELAAGDDALARDGEEPDAQGERSVDGDVEERDRALLTQSDGVVPNLRGGSERTSPGQSALGNTERAEPYDEEPMSPDPVTDTRGPEVTRMPGSARRR